MKYHKELQFHNLFTQEEDVITLTWSFQTGFISMDDAKNAVFAIGQNPDFFLYIKHHGFLYPVAANLLEQAIVVSPDYIWYRIPNSEYITCISAKSNETIPYVINSCKSSDYYKLTMCQDLSSFDPDMRITPGIEVKKSNKAYKDFCVATLGAVMVETLIPTFQLDCMDIYFKNTASFLQFWEFGVKEYNPFNGHRIMAPYSLHSYLQEKSTTQEEMQQIINIRNLLMDLGVLKDVGGSDTVRLPSYLGKKIVLILNALLSDMGDNSELSARNLALKDALSQAANPHSSHNASEKAFHFCRICQISLPHDTIDNICPLCKEQEQFVAVKDYIRENDVTENDVVEHFNIPLSQVRGWIREGRISYKEMRGIHTQEKEGTVRVCKECGIALPSSCRENLCRSCLDLAEATKNRNKKKYIMNSTKISPSNETMRYYGRDK